MYAYFIGNFYNLIYILGFLIKNMLWLRVLMIIGAMIEIYYYALIGDKELIVNLIWCIVWILVNLIQLLFLIKERIGIKFTEREKIIYKLAFLSISEINFKKLLKIAKWNKASENIVLIEKAQELDELIFITEGVAKVESDNCVTAYIADGNFAGEMSFITQNPTSAKVTTVTKVEYLSWERKSLVALIKKSKELEEGMKTIFNYDLVKKLSKMMTDPEPSLD
jgi:hypothetical protein